MRLSPLCEQERALATVTRGEEMKRHVCQEYRDRTGVTPARRTGAIGHGEGIPLALITPLSRPPPAGLASCGGDRHVSTASRGCCDALFCNHSTAFRGNTRSEVAPEG